MSNENNHHHSDDDVKLSLDECQMKISEILGMKVSSDEIDEIMSVVKLHADVGVLTELAISKSVHHVVSYSVDRDNTLGSLGIGSIGKQVSVRELVLSYNEKSRKIAEKTIDIENLEKKLEEKNKVLNDHHETMRALSALKIRIPMGLNPSVVINVEEEEVNLFELINFYNKLSPAFNEDLETLKMDANLKIDLGGEGSTDINHLLGLLNQSFGNDPIFTEHDRASLNSKVRVIDGTIVSVSDLIKHYNDNLGRFNRSIPLSSNPKVFLNESGDTIYLEDLRNRFNSFKSFFKWNDELKMNTLIFGKEIMIEYSEDQSSVSSVVLAYNFKNNFENPVTDPNAVKLDIEGVSQINLIDLITDYRTARSIESDLRERLSESENRIGSVNLRANNAEDDLESWKIKHDDILSENKSLRTDLEEALISAEGFSAKDIIKIANASNPDVLIELKEKGII